MYRHEEKSSNERYLEEQVEDYRQQLQRQQDEATKERDNRRREWQEQMRSIGRQADNWYEALSKQEGLMGAEAVYGGETDQFFDDGSKACKRALEIWKEVDKTKASERQRLQALLDQIDMEIRTEVADKLDAECQSTGWKQVANALRDEDMSPSEWLNW